MFLFNGCAGDEKAEVRWYKGNLHTHSYWSDGDEYPEMIMDWYKTNGYHFVALSDHNILADSDKWIKVIDSKMYQDGFEKYLDKYGEPWVKFNVDSGRTHVKLKTYLEYKYLFEDENFLIIKSEEITSRLDGKQIHMNATNVQSLILPQSGKSVTEVMQLNVDAVLKQRQETGIPMFPHINHPNFYFSITPQDIIDLKGEQFFEVYNGHPLVHNYGDSTRPGTEQMWDVINLAYLKKGQPLLYGLATDDSHNYHQFGAAYSNAGRGWVMVLADSLNPSSLIRAMEAGQFYASTGVTLEQVTVNDKELTIEIKTEPDVTYEIEFIGATKNDTQTRVLKTTRNTKSSIQITPDHLFVRARVTSSRLKPNPFQEGDHEMAWTQPVKP
jgi:predicted metal-dependent phosphoesterase TrpH